MCRSQSEREGRRVDPSQREKEGVRSQSEREGRRVDPNQREKEGV